MKHTQELNVYIDNNLGLGELVIHPNDGFDLGLMHAQYPVSIHSHTMDAAAGENALIGRIFLRNSCTSGTLQVCKKQWEMMGKDKNVILAIKTNKVFIVSQKSKAV